jgi:hypothetical protein
MRFVTRSPISFSDFTMTPTFLGLSAVGWEVMVESWWDKVRSCNPCASISVIC